MNATIINKFGRIVGWNNITVRMLNRNLEGIEGVKYNDELDIQTAKGAGRYSLGHTEGNYDATASLTLWSEEMVALQASLPKGARLQDIPAFQIVVQYDRYGFIQTDVIQNCRIKDNGREVKNGDGKIVHELTLIPSHIDWNV